MTRLPLTRTQGQLLILLLAGLLTGTAFGQGPFGIGVTANRHQVGVGVGLEPELITLLGYSYGLGSATNGPQVRLGAGVILPPYLIHTGSGRISGLLALDWPSLRPGLASRWGGRMALLPYYARDRNEAGTLDALGLEIRLMPLHRSDHWTNGLDLGWQGALLTHIRNSERVKENFTDRYMGSTVGNFSSPQDGWYGGTANRFRLGYKGGRRLGRSVTGQISVGTLLVLQRQGLLLSFAHAQIPFYLDLTFGVGW